jgi:RimJ/RimL family protein N-acetyltransferase
MSALPPRLRVRLMEAADRDRIEAGIAQLSPTSLYLRYGKTVRPSTRELAWLTSLDGRSSVAYGACDPLSGEPVGVARYVASSPSEAEVALTVVDPWQGRGVGRVLLGCLAEHAAGAGIETLWARIYAENRRAVALMRRIGGRPTQPPQFGVVEMRVQLTGTDAEALA